MFKKIGRIFSICLVLIYFVTFTTSCSSNYVGDVVERVNKPYLEVEEYMVKSNIGTILTLPIEKKPIAVVLENISDENRDAVIKAITALDEISTNINYNILETDKPEIINKIYIKGEPVPNDSTPGERLGFASYTCNAFTGKIQYPIKVYIDVEKCEYNNDVICGVLKHELLHTLGFCDLYDENYKEETIMYYLFNLGEYTESDKERVRKVYGGESEKL